MMTTYIKTTSQLGYDLQIFIRITIIHRLLQLWGYKLLLYTIISNEIQITIDFNNTFIHTNVGLNRRAIQWKQIVDKTVTLRAIGSVSDSSEGFSSSAR